jgi:hypothetical protein
LAYAVIKAKLNPLILISFLLSFINFSLIKIQEDLPFAIIFAAIIKHSSHLLKDMWMIHLTMAVALTPLGFMESLFIKLAPFYLHLGSLLPEPSFISITLPKALDYHMTYEQITL